MLPTAVVAIPVYKATPCLLETFSLERIGQVLGRHAIVFFGPESLDFSFYQAQMPAARLLRFDDRYFRSKATYSELLLRSHFYQEFVEYEFLLIHQLDALVFEDQIEEWCRRKWDYIGAPWLGGDRWIGVGNGGFSLRRVRSHLEVLGSRRRLRWYQFWYHSWRTRHHPFLRIGSFSRLRDFDHFLECWIDAGEPEDNFWGRHAVSWHPSFRVAPVEESIAFSVEEGIEQAHRKLRVRAPFGCHDRALVEMVHHYSRGIGGPRDAREEKLWDLARLAGMQRDPAGA